MRSISILFLLCGYIGSAQAAPVTWTLDGVVLEQILPDSVVEQTSLTGSFVYDSDTNLYSDVHIQSETGSYYLIGTTYTEDADRNWKPSAIESPSSTSVIFNSAGFIPGGCLDACDKSLTLEFASALTNSGGTIALSGQEELIGQSWGLYDGRSIASGSVSAVPVPAAVWMFSSALAGLGWIRRKQTR